MADDSTESVAPSPSSEPSATPATSTPAVESTAPASTPQGDTPAGDSGKSSKETLLDAVLKVVPATTEKDVLSKTEGTASPETPTEPEAGQAEASPDDSDDDTELSAEEADAQTRKKFSKLLKQRREMKQALQQWEAVRPMAEIGAKMQDFAQANELSGEDVAKGMSVMAALRRGDWAGFYQEVSPFVRKAQEYLGLALPADMRQRVQQGHLTEDAAREFVRLSMDKQRTDMVRTAEQQVYAERALQQTQGTVEQSVNALEARIAASDPDYKAKAYSVKQIAKAMLHDRGGSIRSPEEALEITKAAYAEVNATFKKFRPQPQATHPPPNGNGSTRSATAEPKTLMEAALQGLARSRNGVAT